MKNKLVQWKGGGYDGCFWEPNTGYFDEEGEWHPIISTGSDGRKTIEEFNAKKGKDDLVFDITEKGLLEFQEHIRDDFFMHTIKELEDAGYDVFWKCSDCDGVMAKTYLFVAFEGYRGDGGIGIVSEGPVCEQCWSNGQCLTCHEYYGEKNLDEHGLCENCRRDASYDYPEIEALEADIARVTKQKEEMIKLKPEHAKSYAKQAKKTIDELNKKLHKLVAHWADTHC